MPGDTPLRLSAAPDTFSDGAVHLRALGREHVDLLVRASRDPDVQRWTLLPHDMDEQAASALLDRWLSRVPGGVVRPYVVSAGADSPPMGQVTMILQDAQHPRRVDVAYWLLPEARGRGLMTRAVQLLAAWLFDAAGAGELALYTKLGNTTSERVAERTGFVATPEPVVAEYQGKQLTLRQWLRQAPRRD